MMTACDLSAITKPWEVQSKVPSCFLDFFLTGILPLPRLNSVFGFYGSRWP